MKVDVVNLDTDAKSSIELPKEVFEAKFRKDILSRVVNWQLANRRAGTHKTKSRGEVALSGKKPFSQKGTGRARQGSSKGPHMRKGGVAFGPQVRTHNLKLQKKIRALGLKIALSSKAKDKKLFVIESEKIKMKKTKEVADKFTKLGWDSVLVITADNVDQAFAKVINNIKRADALPTQGLNVYDILKHQNLVLTKDAVEKINQRLKK